MKVLLDECLPRKFKNHLRGHECRTVPEMGLAGRKNGDLLLLAEQAGFDVFVTIDRGIEYEQNLKRLGIGVILVCPKSNRLADLVPHAAKILGPCRPFDQGSSSASNNSC